MLAKFKDKSLSYLNEDRQGAETLEYVVVGAILVIAILAVAQFLLPTLYNKVNEIADDISNSGANFRA